MAEGKSRHREPTSPKEVTARAEHRFAKADKQRAGVKADLIKEIARERGRVERAKKELKRRRDA
jgi:hypothetical protein